MDAAEEEEEKGEEPEPPDPEDDEGNIEYKYHITNINFAKISKRLT